MRLSIDVDDPGYDFEKAITAKVFMDDAELKERCITADEEAGEEICFLFRSAAYRRSRQSRIIEARNAAREGEDRNLMSAKTRIYKKVHKEIRKQKPALINQIARELLTQPLKERLKLAWKIVRG